MTDKSGKCDSVGDDKWDEKVNKFYGKRTKNISYKNCRKGRIAYFRRTAHSLVSLKLFNVLKEKERHE